jgi:hypothetical protein
MNSEATRQSSDPRLSSLSDPDQATVNYLRIEGAGTNSMTASSDVGGGQPSVKTGYEWLNDRAARAIEKLNAIEIAERAPILADDMFFHPIYRTLSQDVVQCLLSALDHLRFLVWSLRSRDKPFPYSQATLIRTAITGGSTALWMVSGTSPVQRRCRAMEFMFNDLKSRLSWMHTTAAEPINQQRPSDELADFERLRVELRRRQDWIVQQANTILSPGRPFTRKSYDQRTTSDTDVVHTLTHRWQPTHFSSVICTTAEVSNTISPLRSIGAAGFQPAGTGPRLRGVYPPPGYPPN